MIAKYSFVKSLKLSKMKNYFLLFLLFIFFQTSLFGQSYPGWFAVYLTDKSNTSFSISQPESFLSEKAILRRQKNFVEIDSTDLPVSSIYLQQINGLASVKYSSKWQNSLLVFVNDSNILMQIQNFSFVKKTEYLGPKSSKKAKSSKSKMGEKGYEPIIDSFPIYGKSLNQLNIIGLTPMHHNRYYGKGVLIAILDAGFKSVDKMNSFSHIFDRNGVVLQQDIVLPGNNIYNENSHGTYVLSTIAAKIPDKYYGAAPEADFLFLRTEDVNNEYPLEEYYWLIGAELADSTGADIITSSLSYTQFDDSTLDHMHNMLDGKSTIISKAASTAVTKGILVVTSAGNDGNSPWKKIGFPSDGIDVITVGAIDSLGNYASLSSQGLSADGRIKPDLVAVGKASALVSPQDKVFYGNGTSFSTPIIAGALSTLVEAHPTKTFSEIRQALYQSCQNYSNPDSLMGYGMPDFFVTDLILRGLPEVNSPKFAFQIMPNPFSSGFYLITNPQDSQEVKISIFDLSGKAVYSSLKVLRSGTQALYISQISELANGIYVVKLETNGEAYTRKIIKQE